MERRFATLVIGIYVLGSISIKKRFCAQAWSCWSWTDWHSIVTRHFKRSQYLCV